MADEKAPKENVAKGWQPTFYDTVGLIIPGSWFLFGLFLLGVDLAAQLTRGREAFALAELGLFLLLAFAVGHLVAALGNILEDIWWAIFGLPTDRPARRADVADDVVTRLQSKVAQILPGEVGTIPGMDTAKWRAIVREIYAQVAAAGRSSRVDVLNAQYGMMRGLAAGSLALAVVAAMTEPMDEGKVALFVAAGVLSFYRMIRFGKGYARELFAQFMSLPVPEGKRPQTGKAGG